MCIIFVVVELDFIKWDIVMGDGDCGEIFKIGVICMLVVVDGGFIKFGLVI